MEDHFDNLNWLQLKGNAQLFARLSSLLNYDKLPPVLLLHGRTGIGKSLFAAKLVARHFCLKGTACGKCANCQLVRKNCHPDVLWIDSKGDGLKVADAARIQSHLQVAPQLFDDGFDTDAEEKAKPARIVVVVDIDLMNTSAINKLLKLFEEPPEFSRVILTSSRMQALLPTLLSRCSKWMVKPPSIDETVEIIKEICDAETIQKLNSIAFEEIIVRCGLSPKKALSEIQQSIDGNHRSFCHELIAADRVLSSLNIAESMASKRIPLDDLLREFEVSLNHFYKKQLLQNSSGLAVSIRSRRDVLRKLKQVAIAQNISLNTQLSLEGIALSGFALTTS
ncbi:MAG: AAA family ATPase [Bdellovibrionota bacterium]